MIKKIVPMPIEFSNDSDPKSEYRKIMLNLIKKLIKENDHNIEQCETVLLCFANSFLIPIDSTIESSDIEDNNSIEFVLNHAIEMCKIRASARFLHKKRESIGISTKTKSMK